MLEIPVNEIQAGVTPFYAAIFGVVYILLTKRVIDMRMKHNETVGLENAELMRAARAHANFIEYTPLLLILAFLLEGRVETANGTYLVHAILAGFLIGRLVHAFSISRVNENVKLRMISMPLTLMPLLASCLGLIASYFIAF